MKKLMIGFAAIALLVPAAAGAKVVPVAPGTVTAAAPAAQLGTAAAGQSNAAFAVSFNGSLSQATNCNGLAQGCAKARGGVGGRPFAGAMDAAITVDMTRASGGCSPAGGEFDLSASNGDALTLDTTGTLCQTASGYSFTGTYNVSGGSGRYESHGVGKGTAKWTLTGNALHGSFQGSFDANAFRYEGGANTPAG